MSPCECAIICDCSCGGMLATYVLHCEVSALPNILKTHLESAVECNKTNNVFKKTATVYVYIYTLYSIL